MHWGITGGLAGLALALAPRLASAQEAPPAPAAANTAPSPPRTPTPRFYRTRFGAGLLLGTLLGDQLDWINGVALRAGMQFGAHVGLLQESSFSLGLLSPRYVALGVFSNAALVQLNVSVLFFALGPGVALLWGGTTFGPLLSVAFQPVLRAGVELLTQRSLARTQAVSLGLEFRPLVTGQGMLPYAGLSAGYEWR